MSSVAELLQSRQVPPLFRMHKGAGRRRVVSSYGSNTLGTCMVTREHAHEWHQKIQSARQSHFFVSAVAVAPQGGPAHIAARAQAKSSCVVSCVFLASPPRRFLVGVGLLQYPSIYARIEAAPVGD